MVPDRLVSPTDPPAQFDTEAARLWWEVSQILIDRRQLTRGDLVILENYVTLSVLLREAKLRGDWRAADKMIGSQTRLARELALTPSSRASLPAAPIIEDLDDLARFKRDDTDLEPCRGERRRDTD